MYSRETCPSAILSTTNLTRTGPGSHTSHFNNIHKFSSGLTENIASLHYVPVSRKCFGKTTVVHCENRTEGNTLFGQNAATSHVDGITRTVTIVLTFK